MNIFGITLTALSADHSPVKVYEGGDALRVRVEATPQQTKIWVMLDGKATYAEAPTLAAAIEAVREQLAAVVVGAFTGTAPVGTVMVPPSPDVTKGHTRAWMARITSQERQIWPAMVTMWLLCLPEYYPAWYVLAVIHLRDIEGVAPIKKSSPQSTHELCIVPVKEDAVLNPLLHRDWLVDVHPPVLAAHVEGLDDNQANTMAAILARSLCAGTLSLDPEKKQALLSGVLVAIDHLTKGTPL
jgi:hypothetical protein